MMRLDYLAQVRELQEFEARAKVLSQDIISQEGKDIGQLLGEFNLPDAEDYEWLTRYSYHTGDNLLFQLKPLIMNTAAVAALESGAGGKIVLLASPRPKDFSLGLFYKWRKFVVTLARELPRESLVLITPGMGQSDFIQSWTEQPAVYVTKRNYYYGYGWMWYFQDMMYPPASDHFTQRSVILPQKYRRLLRLKI